MTRKQRRIVLIASGLGVLRSRCCSCSARSRIRSSSSTHRPTSSEKHVAARRPHPPRRPRRRPAACRAAIALSIRFEVTDGNRSIPVTYQGILPDLFREGQGIVAEGSLDGSGVFKADNVLAKHDETLHAQGRGRCPEEAGALEGRVREEGRHAVARRLSSPLPPARGRVGEGARATTAVLVGSQWTPTPTLALSEGEGEDRRRGRGQRRERSGRMIEEIGHYALVLALALALIQSTVPLIGARTRDAALMAVAEPVAIAQFGFVALSFCRAGGVLRRRPISRSATCSRIPIRRCR